MRFWKTHRIPDTFGCHTTRYQLQARWEHFGDAKGPGDIFVTWDLPADMRWPTDQEQRKLSEFCSMVEGNYETAADANAAWQRAIAATS